MPVIVINSGIFCKKDEIIEGIAKNTGYRIITDEIIVSDAVKISAMKENKILSVFNFKTSLFNKFTREKEKAFAYLKYAAILAAGEQNIIIEGKSGLLITNQVAHFLKICFIADLKFRINQAKQQSINEKEAIDFIHDTDSSQSYWSNLLYNTNNPWDPTIYDIIFSVGKIDTNDIVESVTRNLNSDVIQPNELSQNLYNDILLASKIEIEFIKNNHFVEVTSTDGNITLTINKSVIMLEKLTEELKKIAFTVEGVKSVETKIGKDFYKTDVYGNIDFETSPKLLLVDDEREFVNTLSDRLLLRSYGSIVAYDGESALKIIKEDVPDVMILDLKMPGLYGTEVLKRVKESNPSVEVIILTGHGTQKDKEECMSLGAFAYLQKPVRTDIFYKVIKDAYNKISGEKINSDDK